jgi:hypothetical protein
MAITLLDILIDMARQLGGFEGTATSGDTTNLVDTRNKETDDYWRDGQVFFLAGPRTGSATVLSWLRGVNTAKLTTGTAITSATSYVMLHRKYPLSMLMQAVNGALARQEYIAKDETLSGDDLDVKALPTGVSNVTRIMVGNDTDGWEIHHQWHERQGEIFWEDNSPDSSQTIRIEYRARPVVLDAVTESLDTSIDAKQVLLDAMADVRRLVWLQNPAEEQNKLAWQEANQKAELNRRPRVHVDPRYTVWK